MADRIPCFREAGINMKKQEFSFYPRSEVDNPPGSEYIRLDRAWCCGEFDEADIALCERCAQALGIVW